MTYFMTAISGLGMDRRCIVVLQENVIEAPPDKLNNYYFSALPIYSSDKTYPKEGWSWKNYHWSFRYEWLRPFQFSDLFGQDGVFYNEQYLPEFKRFLEDLLKE